MSMHYSLHLSSLSSRPPFSHSSLFPLARLYHYVYLMRYVVLEYPVDASILLVIIRVPGELNILKFMDLVQLCFKLFVYNCEVHLIDDLYLSKDKNKLCTRQSVCSLEKKKQSYRIRIKRLKGGSMYDENTRCTRIVGTSLFIVKPLLKFNIANCFIIEDKRSYHPRPRVP